MKLSIYVISVRSFTERHVHIERLAEKFGFSFEFVWEYDADLLSMEDLRRVSTDLSPRSASNALKHIEAQIKFLESDDDFLLVLEDDVILFEGFSEALRIVLAQAKTLSLGWLIFLGGADNKIDQRFLESEGISLINASITTAEAYLVDRLGCAKRLEWCNRNLIDRQADHLLKKIDRDVGNTHYCISRAIATQGSITGKFNTSLDASRQKHGRMYLAIRYHYNRFRRQIFPRIVHRLWMLINYRWKS